MALREIVVVLSVVTLAGTTLVAALGRAREAERSVVCQWNLGRLGEAISAYVADNGNYLPGPIHIGLPYDAGDIFQNTSRMGSAWYEFQPAAYLNPYLRGRADDARNVDTLSYCPTAEGIPVASSEGQDWFYQPRLYYIANTAVAGTETPGEMPYYATNPPSYFGAVNVRDPSPWALPKQLDAIANHAREWSVADVWYWEYHGIFGGQRRVGTWPFPVEDYTVSSVANDGELKIPSYPFHNTGKIYSPDGNDTSLDTPRLTDGVTNTLFFDAHVEGVRGWTGSVNPNFGTAGASGEN